MNSKEPEKNPQRRLLHTMENVLFPFLNEKGFRLVQHPTSEPTNFNFNRVTPEKVHCLMFALDKNTRPKFQVLIAAGPVAGVTLNLPSNALQYWGNQAFRPGHDLCWADCPGERAILKARTRRNVMEFFGFDFRRWFIVQRPDDGDWETASRKPIQLFIGYFSECEAWWTQKTYGPHVSKDERAASDLERLDKKYGKFIIEN